MKPMLAMQSDACGWIVSPGRRCQVPVTRRRVGRARGATRAPFCLYHRARCRMRLYGTFTSEQKAFLNWIERYQSGLRETKDPSFWQQDREQLWRLIDGQVTWPECCAAWRQAQLSA